MHPSISGHGGVLSENCGFDYWTSGIGKTTKERDLKDVSEIKIDRIGRERIGEAIERFARARFHLSKELYDFVYRGFVNDTVRFPDEKSEIFAKFDVGGRFHPSEP